MPSAEEMFAGYMTAPWIAAGVVGAIVASVPAGPAGPADE